MPLVESEDSQKRSPNMVNDRVAFCQAVLEKINDDHAFYRSCSGRSSVTFGDHSQMVMENIRIGQGSTAGRNDW
jgi:hypothetical protein